MNVHVHTQHCLYTLTAKFAISQTQLNILHLCVHLRICICLIVQGKEFTFYTCCLPCSPHIPQSLQQGVLEPRIEYMPQLTILPYINMGSEQISQMCKRGSWTARPTKFTRQSHFSSLRAPPLPELRFLLLPVTVGFCWTDVLDFSMSKDAPTSSASPSK